MFPNAPFLVSNSVSSAVYNNQLSLIGQLFQLIGLFLDISYYSLRHDEPPGLLFYISFIVESTYPQTIKIIFKYADSTTNIMKERHQFSYLFLWFLFLHKYLTLKNA